MVDETQDLINIIYERKTSNQVQNKPEKTLRKSSKPKYQIFDETEFSRGREVLGEIIVHGMLTSGGTDIDWLIEHKGGFIILEFKGFHNDKINISQGQMTAYEKLYEKLNKVTKCYLYIVGCDDIDFSNPDSSVRIFGMNQWKNNIIPKNTTDIFDEKLNKQNKFIVYREFMEEISVEKLRELIDSHWKEFESL